MKIESYKKLKNGKYRLLFDNSETLDVYEDVILKLELLLKKNISESLKQKILEENEKQDVYAVGLKYIDTRVRSKKEVIDYLKRKEYSFSNISRISSRLCAVIRQPFSLSFPSTASIFSSLHISFLTFMILIIIYIVYFILIEYDCQYYY